MSKIQFDNGVMILSAVDPLSNRMSIQILQLPHPPKLEPLDFLFEPTANSRKRVRPSKETRAIVERELMLVRANSKFTEHFNPPPTTPIMQPRPLSASSYESAMTSSEGTTCSRSTRRRRPSLGLVHRLFASSDPEPEPLGEFGIYANFFNFIFTSGFTNTLNRSVMARCRYMWSQAYC
jgi:hypothetical protein